MARPHPALVVLAPVLLGALLGLVARQLLRSPASPVEQEAAMIGALVAEQDALAPIPAPHAPAGGQVRVETTTGLVEVRAGQGLRPRLPPGELLLDWAPSGPGAAAVAWLAGPDGAPAPILPDGGAVVTPLSPGSPLRFDPGPLPAALIVLVGPSSEDLSKEALYIRDARGGMMGTSDRLRIAAFDLSGGP